MSWMLTNLNILVLIIPIVIIINDVNINTITIDNKVFPILFGLFTLYMDVIIVKNRSGTIVISNMFMNKSPKGFKTIALSFRIIPISVPSKIKITNIMEFL